MRYVMKQKMIALGDDYVVKDEKGDKVFYIDAAKFSIGDKLSFQDMEKNELAFIKSKLLSWGPKYLIYRDDKHYATIKKKWSFWGIKIKIDIPGPDDLIAKGKIAKREYKLVRHRQQVAKISKGWFNISGSYGVDIEEGEDDVLILASVVAIDMLIDKLVKKKDAAG
jgi:uncharacterized protein YxjI